MTILYFGNRDYWNIAKLGHTRFEQIFKALIDLDEDNLIYSSIYIPRQLIKHFPFYLKNIFRTKIIIVKNIVICFTRKKKKLCILSIYSNDRNLVLKRCLDSVHRILARDDSDKWIWFNNPFHWHAIKGIKNFKYVFDSFELYFSVVEYKHQKEKIHELYREISYNVSLLTTVTNAGLDYFKNLNPQLPVYVVKNGVNFKEFVPGKNKKEKGQKVIGLIGNFNSNHNYDGLVEAATYLDNVKFILIGKAYNKGNSFDEHTKENLEKLYRLPNVEYHKWIPSSELPKYINRFDAGLITYKTKKHDPTNLLNTGDSLKKYQYLACNVPVITSDCQDFDDKLSKGITVYYDEKELKSAIKKVLFQESHGNLRELVQDYDWSLKVKEILEYIKQVKNEYY